MKSKREVIFEGDPGFIEDPEGYDATEDIVRVFIYDGMVGPFGTGYSECQLMAMNPGFRIAEQCEKEHKSKTIDQTVWFLRWEQRQ